MKELLEDLNIKHITSTHKSPAEMGKLSASQDDKRNDHAVHCIQHLDVLPKIVDNYNNTYHTTIKNTPAAVWAGGHMLGKEEHKGQRGQDAGNPGEDQRCFHVGAQDLQLCVTGHSHSSLFFLILYSSI